MATPPTFVGWYTSAIWSTAGGATTRTTTYSGQAGDRIALVFAAENADFNLVSIANDGAALTWTPQEVHDPGAADRPYAGIYSSTLDTTRTIVVTITKSGPTMEWGLGLSVWRDSDGFGVSEKADNAGLSGQPALTMVTQPNSAVVAVNSDWNATSGSRTYRNPYTSSAVEDLYGGTIGLQYAVEVFHYADTAAGGSDVIGLTAPSTQRYGIVGLEILGTSTPLDPGWGKYLLEDGSGYYEMEGTTDDYLLDTAAADPNGPRPRNVFKSNPALNRSFNY